MCTCQITMISVESATLFPAFIPILIIILFNFIIPDWRSQKVKKKRRFFFKTESNIVLKGYIQG